MTGTGLVALLLSFLASGPVCGVDAAEPVRRAFVAELNLRRLVAGGRAVESHPALCELARESADHVARSGSVDIGVRELDRMTRRVYRLGYRPHGWTQTAFILNWGKGALDQWEEVGRRSYDEAVDGDFEHLGLGTGLYEGRPVYSVVLALSARTVEWRQAAPLADIDQVRREILAAVNATRLDYGREPLNRDPKLDIAAQRHAEDQLAKGYYGHRSVDGRSPAERARAAGYRARRLVSENIAKGLFTPSEVVDRWFNSPGHRKNLLLRQARDLGVGVAYGETDEGLEVLWVQLFGG